MERVFILQLLYSRTWMSCSSILLDWSLLWQWRFEQIPWILALVQTWSNLPVVQGTDPG